MITQVTRILARIQDPHRFPVVGLLRILPEAGVWHLVGIAATVVSTAAIGTGTIVASGYLIGTIPKAVEAGLNSPEARRLFLLLGLTGALFLLQAGLSSFQGLIYSVLSSRFDFLIKRKVMAANLKPDGIAHLEDPRYLDEVRLALPTDATPASTLNSLLRVGSQRLMGIGSAIILFRFAWWAPLLLVIALVIQYRWLIKEQDNLYQHFVQGSEGLRRSNYFWELAVGGLAAKEIRVFGLPDFLVERHSRHWIGAMTAIWKSRHRLSGEMVRAVSIVMAAFGFFFIWLARAAVNRDVDLTGLAIYAQAGIALFYAGVTEDAHYRLRRGARGIAHISTLNPRITSPDSNLGGSSSETQGLPSGEIRFNDVAFSYPGTDKEIFRKLNLVIPAGRSLAIVGDNGAGKTTLVKLICRLYDPREGAVSVDGVPLTDLEPEAWRERVSVIFQDFVKYPLSAKDNVAFGGLHLKPDNAILQRAARLAGAESIIAELPNGWETILSRQYRGGADLSGGQWQRIALARALLTAELGGVLILDEPTASLDVRAEAELFERFLEITRGLTTLLISHRFSTVRRVDRICVLDGGDVIEEGSHEELLAVGGKYARMFTLQAERFQEEEADA